MTFQEIIDKEKAISREEALQEGIAEGRAEGIAEGLAKGRAEALQKLSVALNIPEAELRALMDAASKN